MVSTSQDSTSDSEKSSAPRQFSEAELNEVVRDLALSEKAAEVIATRMHESGLLEAKFIFFKKKGIRTFWPSSQKKSTLFVATLPLGLLGKLVVTFYSPAKWLLFLGINKRSLKCVLVHNSNVYGAIPVSHSVYL
ncbi:hypothetical protein AVEN_96495-1 [Araneus ventricosus]|uniref:Uncharacterized protein n=1 Tax=Araneus ventricosus TaxID=182803 RepID=A0A4Y2CVX7_ARAVE|nr:hypothetical protein AVEN_96495-1 [Araneus ventricosus]